jgi:hypothetical protein
VAVVSKPVKATLMSNRKRERWETNPIIIINPMFLLHTNRLLPIRHQWGLNPCWLCRQLEELARAMTIRLGPLSLFSDARVRLDSTMHNSCRPMSDRRSSVETLQHLMCLQWFLRFPISFLTQDNNKNQKEEKRGFFR